MRGRVGCRIEMMRKNTFISKIGLAVLVAFCLPLVACSKGGGKDEVLLGGTKGKTTTSWMSGPKEKGSKNTIQIGAKKGGGGFGGSKAGGVKVPKIGGFKKKKGKNG